MIVTALHELYSAEEIDGRVRAIAGQIDRLYRNEPLVMVCVLKGAFMFFSDLVKRVSVQPELDFVRVASYGEKTASSDTVVFSKDTEISLAGKHLVLVEDVVDSGRTVRFLADTFAGRGVKSLRVAALVDKKERREVDAAVDFVGFDDAEGFIVGYGMDYAERYRDLPSICIAEFEGNIE